MQGSPVKTQKQKGDRQKDKKKERKIVNKFDKDIAMTPHIKQTKQNKKNTKPTDQPVGSPDSCHKSVPASYLFFDLNFPGFTLAAGFLGFSNFGL